MLSLTIMMYITQVVSIASVLPFTPTIEQIVAVLGVIGTISGLYYTWKKERQTTISGRHDFEKDYKDKLQRDNVELRGISEKYIMLRRKILDLPGIDGHLLIQEIETEWRDMNPQ